MRKIFFRLSADLYPHVKYRYPFLYLEHGRLEVDDSSVKWISSKCEVVRLPIAVINSILLGPGTSVTHEAIKAISQARCSICWVGEESLKFYAYGMPPTSDTINLYRQLELAFDKDKRQEVARRMFLKRFPGVDLSDKTLEMFMGMEGARVRKMYKKMSEKYAVEWSGRSYIPGKPESSDPVNKILTFANSILYGVVTSIIISCGYSPRIGFVHSRSPLPFVYDIADLYKEFVTIDLSFSYVSRNNLFDRNAVIDEVISRMIEINIMEELPQFFENLFKDV